MWIYSLKTSNANRVDGHSYFNIPKEDEVYSLKDSDLEIEFDIIRTHDNVEFADGSNVRLADLGRFSSRT